MLTLLNSAYDNKPCRMEKVHGSHAMQVTLEPTFDVESSYYQGNGILSGGAT